MGTLRIGNKTIQDKIMRAYFYFVFAETNYYLKTKFYFLGRTLGVQKPLGNYDYNRNDRMQYCS